MTARKPFHRCAAAGWLLAAAWLLCSGAATAQPGSNIWRFTTAHPIIASPAIGADGTIYVGSYENIYALTPAGSNKWVFPLLTSATYPDIYSSPAIGPDGTIYFGGAANGLLYAVDPVTGTNKWSYAIGSFVYSDPAIGADGAIYVGSYNSIGNNYLYAINPNGALRWRYLVGGSGSAIFSDPVIGRDGAIYFGADDGKLYAVNTNGTLRWSLITGNKAITASPAIGRDGKIYVGVGSVTNPKFYCANTNGTTNWIFSATNRIRSSAAIGADGTIYFGSDDHNLYALNPNGTVKWAASTGHTNASSPALAADGTIYIGSYNSNVYAFTSSGSNLWSFATSNYVYSSPVIASNGRVYVGSADRTFYVLSGPSPLAATVWPMFRRDELHTARFLDFKFTCSAPKTVESGAAWDFDPPALFDLCESNDIAVLSTVTNATCGITFTAMRTWQVTDPCGNTNQCSQTVSVVDSTPPVITCVSNKTLELGAAWDFNAPSATDSNGPPTVTVLTTVTNALCGNTFTATRTWKATDVCGNTNICSQLVHVADTTSPAITCASTQTVDYTNSWSFTTPTATDAGGTPVITVLTTVTNSSCSNSFSVIRTWRATDPCGHTNQCSQTMIVVQAPPPSVTCGSPKSAEFGSAWSFDPPVARDFGRTTTFIVAQNLTNAGCGNTYSVTRTWHATDNCGFTNECSQTVTLVDTTPPTMNCTNKTVEFGATWSFDPPPVTDIGGTNLFVVLATVTNAGCGNTYTAIRTWRATDACGNSNQCSQTVSVVDTTPPAITCGTNRTVEFGGTWDFDEPTATDLGGTNVIIVLTTVTNANCGNTYTAIRTWRATDACGNLNQCSQTVTVVDTTPPAIVCVPNKTVDFTNVWSFDPPSATDIGGTNVIAVLTTVTNGTCTNSFDAIRTWRAADACGNTNQCSQTVTVLNVPTPFISCSPTQTVEFGVAWDFALPVTNNFGVPTEIAALDTVTNAVCGNTFTAIRHWQATDVCGNTNECYATVQVVDTTPPTIICVSNKTMEFGAAWSFDSPTATDIGGTNVITVLTTVTNASCGNTFNATRTWRATDACGNTNQCSQTVTVVDTTPPAIACVTNKTLEFGAAWDFDAPTATDIGGTNVISILTTVTNAACGNTFNATRTWRATDACGNTNACSQTVTVVDTTAPIITCVTNKTLEFGAAWSFDSPTASDIGGTNTITVLTTVTNASCGNTFTATRTWRATDACGNTNGCSQTVTVVDTTAPTITCATNKTVEFGAAWSFDSPTATDIGGTNIVNILTTVTNAACGNTFSAMRTWRATDACGNTNGCSQTVNIVDTTAPTITCATNKTLEFGAVWDFDPPTATDIGGTNVITLLTTVTNAGCGNTFSALRTWQATDACGNTNACSQIVTVVDTTAPTITCVTDKTVEFGAAWDFDTPTATDIGGTNAIIVLNTVTNANCGNTFSATRTWRVTDACGNTNGCSQTVTVVDTTAPAITCVTNKTVEFTNDWSFDAPSATDIGGTNGITVLATVTNVTCTNSFEAIRTWRATDACGNTNACSQVVTVLDTPSLTITCATNQTVEFGEAWNFDTPTATDFGGTPVITVLTTVTNAACGNTFTATRTWQATNACGSTNECSQTVNVRDTTPPAITCVTNKSVEFGAEWNFDPPTATDIGGTNVITLLTTVTNAGCGNTFTAIRTWQATDACGNPNQCSQTVTVVDTTPPTINCVTNKTAEFGAAWDFDEPTASDIGGTNVITALTSVTNSTCGNTFTATRTWRATDACGNTNSCSQTVTVVDTTAPAITCATNKTLVFGEAWAFDPSTATDIGGTNVIVVLTTVTNFSCTNSFEAIRTWRATDACGNTNACSQIVTVLDTPSLTITCATNQTLEFGEAWDFGTPTATDFGGTPVITVLTTVTNVACGNTFTATRTWQATNACGNTNKCSQAVNVVDTTAPTITCATNQTVEFSAEWDFDSPTATDSGGTNSIIVLTTVTNSTCGNGFNAIRMWQATDACGNTNTCSQTIAVLDNAPPTINCPADITVNAASGACFSNVTFTVTATDLCGSVTNLISVPASGSAFAVGTTTVTNTAFDNQGHASQCTFIVTVLDQQPPTITCPSQVTTTNAAGTNVALNVSLGVPTTNDNCGVFSVSSNAPAQYPVGTNLVTWTVVDLHDNTNTCQQRVVVTNPPPAISCPASVTVFAAAGVCSATNVALGSPTVTYPGCGNVVVTSNAPAQFPLGTNTVTWTATDQCGGSASCQQKVIVRDNQQPVITCPANIIVNAATGTCASNVTFSVTATDNCAVTNIVSVPASGSAFAFGTTTVTNKAFDSSGNSNQCTFTVTVRDAQPPTITCPANITVNTATGTCASNVTFSVTATDLCGSVTNITSVPASGSAFAVGTTTVTNKAFDSSGNSNQCTFTVTVRDTQLPVITCPANITVNAATGACSSNVTFSVTATDNCAVTNIVSVPASGSAFAVGTTTVTNKAFDSSGNSNQCTFTVTVRDTQLPVITCPTNITVNAAAGVCSSNVTFSVTATDNCAVTNIVSTPASGSVFAVGTTTVTNKAFDSSGNSNQCTFTVTVRDIQPPTITCPANITVNAATGTCASNVTFSVTATDLCGSVTNITSVPASGSAFAVGTTTVTNTAFDSAGNSNQCTFAVTVRDTQLPAITCPANITVNAATGTCASNVTFSVTATDNCGVTNIVSVPASGSAFAVGTTTVTNKAFDSSGNSNQCTFTVTVRDTQLPLITCPTNIIVNAATGICTSNVTFSVTATDNCAVTNIVSTPASGSAFALGTTTVTNKAFDSSGNSNQCTFTVTVRDIQPPTITCPASITVNAATGTCTSNVTFSVTATDLCGGVTNITSVPASGSAFAVGTVTVTSTAFDNAGNSNQCMFTVTVRDTQPPTITCPTNITVNSAPGSCSSNVTFSVTATDLCGSVTNIVSTPVSGSTFSVGTTTVTNKAFDSFGNSNQCIFTVTVLDSQLPTITCPSNITVNAAFGTCASNVTFTVAATNSCGTTVTNVDSVPPSGSAFQVGTTIVTNTVFDSVGHSNQCTFTVTVRDAQPPTITCPTNITVNAAPGACASNVTFTVNATDNCAVTNIVSVPPSGSAFAVGTTTVTNTAFDNAGNSNQCTFTVTVRDTQLPVLTCPANIIVNAAPGACSSNVNFSVTATDNCGVTNLVSTPASGFAFPVGTTTVTNKAFDTSGNSNQCTFTVTVRDTQLPGITCPTNIIVNAAPGSCASNVTFVVSATDNCAVTNLVSTPASGSAFAVGTTTVTNKAFDSSGNSNQCTFTVTVRDAQLPVLTCPANITVNAAPGACSSNVTFSVTATDNCAVTNLVSVPASGSAFSMGTTIVTNKAFDSSGNSNQCTFTVTVRDTQLPVLTCPSNIIVNVATGTCVSNVTFVVSATDNCAVTNIVSTPASGSAFAVGTTTVTNQAFDSSGNSNQCTFTVTIGDTQLPVITCPTNVTVNAATGACASNVTFSVNATDNCSVTNLVSTPASGSAFAVGTTTVTSKAFDSSGNSNQCTFTVTVRDAQPPAITCPANISVNPTGGGCTRKVSFTVTATDNCGVTSLVSTPASASTFSAGTTIVTNTALDAAGNSSQCTFTVTVVETTPPTITCPANITVNAAPGACSSNVTFSVTAADNCGVASIVSVPSSGSAFAVGTTIVTNTVFDNVGNSNQCTFTVTVRDTQLPVITCPTNIIVNAATGTCVSNVTFVVTATDNCAVTNIISTPASGSAFALGTTTVTNKAFDSSGNSNQCTFTVTVRDAQPPTITCPANITVNAATGTCASNVTFSVTATDLCGSVTNIVSVPASGSAFAVGTTPVTSKTFDNAGNSNQCTFTVTVRDTQLPVITCPANVTVNAAAGTCASNVTFTVNATDNCGVTNIVSVPASGSAFALGTSTVTNKVFDSSGNSNQCTFTVTVRDTQLPVVNCPSNIIVNATTGSCASNVTFVVTATDNCAVTNIISTPASGSAFALGTTTVTNKAFDSSGNSNQCTFTVTVRDAQPPTITCPTNITVNAAPGTCASNVTFSVTATDLCGSVTNITSVPVSGSAFAVGTTTVTNKAFDSSGNSNQCTFTVTVRDTQLPVLTCPTNITVNAATGTCASNVTFVVTATDNCAVTNIVSTPASGSAFALGTTTVTNNAFDSSGNSNQCTFTVTVRDTQLPVITCPANVTVNAAAGTCASNVTFTVNATDNCGVTNITSVPVSGSAFVVGTTTVTNKAFDSSGNSNQCTFMVTVLDGEPPIISCPANITTTNVPGLCAVVVNLGMPVATNDNCGILTVTNNAPATFPFGATLVTWTVVDNSGNTASCVQTVTVEKVAFAVSGLVELQSFTGTNRLVRFVTSEVQVGVTNLLQTNDVLLTFTGGSAAYNLIVPTNTTHVSAKTAWNLRRRQAATFTCGAATVDFTGAIRLKGGDIVTIADGTIADTDNAVTSSDYLLLLGNYLQTVGGSPTIGRADIDGDGAITSSDYLNLLGNYLTTGDLQ